MRFMHCSGIAITILSASVVLGAQAGKAPAPAPKAKLPAAVEAAFKKAYPNAVIKDVSSEKEDGKVVWEVESVDGKTNRDIIYTPDGMATVIEEGITVADVPPPVLASLKARYPKATVTSYERVIRGTVLSFEMLLKGGPAEVEIAADGVFINPKPIVKKK